MRGRLDARRFDPGPSTSQGPASRSRLLDVSVAGTLALPARLLLAVVVLFTALLNLFIGSASACRWRRS